jgi:hypothetical protein
MKWLSDLQAHKWWQDTCNWIVVLLFVGGVLNIIYLNTKRPKWVKRILKSKSHG